MQRQTKGKNRDRQKEVHTTDNGEPVTLLCNLQREREREIETDRQRQRRYYTLYNLTTYRERGRYADTDRQIEGQTERGLHHG